MAKKKINTPGGIVYSTSPHFKMEEEKSVLHISTALSWRGGEQQLAYLLESLEENVEQYVLCAKGSAMEKFCQEKGYRCYAQKKTSGLDLGFALTIKKLCRTLEIDLCHMHDAHAHTFAILAAYLGNKTPLILSRRVDFPIKQKWTSKKKYNHPAIKKILCVSDTIKKITAPDIEDKNKLVTVHSGIDLKKFSAPKGILRKDLKINGDPFLVGNTSALADHKDYFTFLDVAAAVIKVDPTIRFVIMGDGPLAKEIKAYHQKLELSKSVVFTGYRTDIPEILAELDAFLITSKTEGLGTSIIDAFAAKVPVVATAAGGIPELVENEKTGLLCAVKDVECLTKAILRIQNEKGLKEKLTEAASEKVQYFSKEATAANTLKYYREVWSL